MIENATDVFYKELDQMVSVGLHPDPQDEIFKIQKTFENTISKNGPDGFNSMLILCDSDYAPAFIAEPRPYTNKEDMYSAFAEMLFSFSAFNAAAFIMVNDTRMTVVESDLSVSLKKDALNIVFVDREAACTIILPYEVNEDDSVTWFTDKFTCSSMEEEDTATGRLVELYFVMSHLDKPPFTMNTLVNYYSFRDFPTVIPDDTIVKRVVVSTNDVS